MLNNVKGAILDVNNAIKYKYSKPENAYYIRGSLKSAIADNAGACSDWKKAVELGNAQAKELLKENCK